jgi:hypothetical protein
MKLTIFLRLYGFHRRGGKPFGTSIRLASRAFQSDLY